MSEQEQSDRNGFSEWAIVEVMGHARLAGLVSEQTIAGHGYIRVDVPAVEGQGAYSRMFGPSAIYSISPVSEDLARRTAEGLRPVPVQAYQLPALPPPAAPCPKQFCEECGEEHDADGMGRCALCGGWICRGCWATHIELSCGEPDDAAGEDDIPPPAADGAGSENTPC